MIELVIGEDTFGSSKYVTSQKAAFIKQHGQDSVSEYSADNLGSKDLPTILGGGSLFSNERMVIINNPGSEKSINEQLATTLKSVPDDVHVLLVEPKPDKRSQWFKAAKKYGQVKEQRMLAGHDLFKWVSDQVRQRGGSINHSDINLLIQRTGENRWRLDREIDKLLLFDKQITQKSIETLVEPTSQETVWQLLDQVTSGQAAKARATYKDLSRGELDPHQFISLLAWQLHTLLVVTLNANQTDVVLAREAGMAPFVIKRMRGMSAKIGIIKLKKIIKLTLNVDKKIKETGADAGRRVELLIAQIGQIISS